MQGETSKGGLTFSTPRLNLRGRFNLISGVDPVRNIASNGIDSFLWWMYHVRVTTKEALMRFRPHRGLFLFETASSQILSNK